MRRQPGKREGILRNARFAIEKLPLVEILPWLAPVGLSTRMFWQCISPRAWRELSWYDVRRYGVWMGLRSFHFIALSAVVVAVALTIQCVIELKKYQAEALTGAAISIGLLRELGPLTISVAWCARVSALIAEEAKMERERYGDEGAFSRKFVLPRYISALATSIPLGAYGLVIGFITAGFFGPLMGVSSINDFVESARSAIHDKDLAVYFVKLIAVNPTVAVFAGCASGYMAPDRDSPVAANAVTSTFLGCLVLNLAVTVAAYLEGDPFA